MPSKSLHRSLVYGSDLGETNPNRELCGLVKSGERPATTTTITATTSDSSGGFARDPSQPRRTPIQLGYLTEEHRARLRRVIPDAMIESRKYTSVLRGQSWQLEQWGYADYQCKPGLLIPGFPILAENSDGTPYQSGSQLRPDHPRVRRGKAIKYESPPGQPNTIDIHPFARPWLLDIKHPLFASEGIIKCDAGVARGLCCVSFPGVWSWMRKLRPGDSDSPSVALPDFRALALRGRSVVIAFDGDAMVKRSVYNALVALKTFLEGKGAKTVHCLYLDPGQDLEDLFSGYPL